MYSNACAKKIKVPNGDLNLLKKRMKSRMTDIVP